MTNSNASRTLNEVVSVDGWIGTFDDEGTAQVHADVVFREGHFGGDPESKLRFKVSLTRAEVILCVPGGAPLKVIRNSIKRSEMLEDRIRKHQLETRLAVEADGKASLDLSKGLDLAASVASTGKAEKVVLEQYDECIREFLVQHFSSPDRHPAWDVKRFDEKTLQGTPWNAESDPRMRIQRSSETEQPFLRIEVRCRREDLQISGLELKDSEKQGIFMRQNDKDKNMAAAEQVIKDELVKAGFLELGDLSEAHAKMLIADVVIVHE